eukprot:scaffold116337_cov32-Tisochrysis_lutea.AAC.2
MPIIGSARCTPHQHPTLQIVVDMPGCTAVVPFGPHLRYPATEHVSTSLREKIGGNLGQKPRVRSNAHTTK